MSLVPPVGARDHAQGDTRAPLTLVEYGDYQCPYCGDAYPIVKGVQKRLGAKLRFVFRNFPLAQAHPEAPLAAEAAEAAGAQGKFWEMHDRLFEHQDQLDPPSLVRHAKHLGLNLESFEADLASHKFEPRVAEDFKSGVRSGVNGTPTFFVNGVRYDGNWTSPKTFGADLLTAIPGDRA
jgi:protein-disulfide isomerase